ncbi:hypothetical protein ABK040_004833 [Willaertia magna]
MNKNVCLSLFKSNKKIHKQFLPFIIQKRFKSLERTVLDPAPGNEKRTKLDLTRRQPEYESPYSGHEVNINKSGFDDTYDVWWDDGAGTKQWAYKDTYPILTTKDALLQFFYFLGWSFALWGFYRYFLQPTLAVHPATLIALTPEVREKAKILREQRLEEMEKYGIEEEK